MQETWVQVPAWEDPLEKGTATHSGTLTITLTLTLGGLVLWPGELHGLYSPWVCEQPDRTE